MIEEDKDGEEDKKKKRRKSQLKVIHLVKKSRKYYVNSSMS